MLAGKKILLGVTGSIAAYKSLQLVRDLSKAGAEVNVVLTSAAHKFVPPLTLKVFSGRPVLCGLFDPENDMAHLRLAEEADLVLIAPITAHFIAKMAGGLADDLLSTLLLSTRAPTLIAPAMDLGMWEHPAIRDNIALLKKRNIHVIEPECGPLASGKEGVGRLACEQTIIDTVVSVFSTLTDDKALSLDGETVLLTAGPTEEAIDPVRFISNRSSGKMGYALAEIASQRGAEVHLISGPTRLPVPPGVKLISVRSTAEMEAAFKGKLYESSIVIMAAAVSDYRPVSSAKQKMKKNSIGTTLELGTCPDILGERTEGRDAQLVVGFAAETENLIQNATKKLELKRLDLIVANDVTVEGAGFNVDTNIVHLINRKKQIKTLPLMSKRLLAGTILEEVLKLRTTPLPVLPAERKA